MRKTFIDRVQLICDGLPECDLEGDHHHSRRSGAGRSGGMRSTITVTGASRSRSRPREETTRRSLLPDLSSLRPYSGKLVYRPVQPNMATPSKVRWFACCQQAAAHRLRPQVVARHERDAAADVVLGLAVAGRGAHVVVPGAKGAAWQPERNHERSVDLIRQVHRNGVGHRVAEARRFSHVDREVESTHPP